MLRHLTIDDGRIHYSVYRPGTRRVWVSTGQANNYTSLTRITVYDVLYFIHLSRSYCRLLFTSIFGFIVVGIIIYYCCRQLGEHVII